MRSHCHTLRNCFQHTDGSTSCSWSAAKAHACIRRRSFWPGDRHVRVAIGLLLEVTNESEESELEEDGESEAGVSR
jgi:hypothetical protein